MYSCSFCGKTYNTNSNRLKHEKCFCLINPDSEALLPKVECPFCGKLCTRAGYNNHVIHCANNPDKKTANWAPWSKGLTKDTNITIRRAAENFSRKVAEKGHVGAAGLKGLDNYVTRPETRAKISKKMLNNHNNNPNKTGRGKKGYYKGFYCASTYELAFVIYCLDHDINIKRYDGFYNYTYKGKQHRYYPDFIIDNTIYEIKGFWTELVDIKAAAVKDREIKILYRKDLKNIFDYIYEKYNKTVDKNISDLYESQD